MKVDVVIRVEVDDQEEAELWAASVCETSRPKCPTCGGAGTVAHVPAMLSWYRHAPKQCTQCGGRGSLEHPHAPEVVGSSRFIPPTEPLQPPTEPLQPQIDRMTKWLKGSRPKK